MPSDIANWLAVTASDQAAWCEVRSIANSDWPVVTKTSESVTIGLPVKPPFGGCQLQSCAGHFVERDEIARQVREDLIVGQSDIPAIIALILPGNRLMEQIEGDEPPAVHNERVIMVAEGWAFAPRLRRTGIENLVRGLPRIGIDRVQLPRAGPGAAAGGSEIHERQIPAGRRSPAILLRHRAGPSRGARCPVKGGHAAVVTAGRVNAAVVGGRRAGRVNLSGERPGTRGGFHPPNQRRRPSAN